MEGYILLHKRLLEKEYFNNSAAVHLWIFLLLNANYEEHRATLCGREVVIKRGQILTGRKKLSEKTGIPETTIERTLNVFQVGHQIGQQKTSKYRIISILNYDKFQKRTSKRTANGQQTDTPNKINNKINIIVSPKGSTKKPMYKETNTTYDEDGNIIEDEGVRLKREFNNQFNLFLKEYEEGYIKNIGDKVPRYTIPAIRRLYSRAIKLGYRPGELLEYLPDFFGEGFYEKTDWSPLTFLGEKVLNSLKNQ